MDYISRQNDFSQKFLLTTQQQSFKHVDGFLLNTSNTEILGYVNPTEKVLKLYNRIK